MTGMGKQTERHLKDFNSLHRPTDEAATQAFRTYGVTIGLHTNEPSLLPYINDCIPPDWKCADPATAEVWYSVVSTASGPGNRFLYTIYQDRIKLQDGYRLKRILNFLDSTIRLYVGRVCRDKLFIHAGSVGWKDRAIIIPGRSGTGKTNLVAALIKAGATYYSDEYAVLDSHGFVHPFARPLSFRQGFGQRIKLCPVVDFGGRQGREPLRVGLVIHTRFLTGATWDVHKISPGEATLALLGNTLAARDRPAFALSVISKTISGVKPLEGLRGEAELAAAMILDQVDRPET